MPSIEQRRFELPHSVQLVLLFVVSVLIMAVFRDVRAPLDGSSYALAVDRLIDGNYDDVFRWSHVLHVPVLGLGYRLLSAVVSVDVLVYYQGLDILLGGCALCLFYLLVRRAVGCQQASLLACVLVFFSWVFWIESVTADEKIMGFVFVLLYLNLIETVLGARAHADQPPSRAWAALLAVILSFAILLHASAVLLIPVSVFLAARSRYIWFGVSVAIMTACLLAGVYLVVLQVIGVSGRDEITAYFSSGVSSYSVVATGLSGLVWLRSVAQGLTKLLWAVFVEDGLKQGMFFAGLNVVVMLGLVVTMWRQRRDRRLQGFAVLFVSVLIFGMTYAPTAPDSYFLALIPIAIFFARALCNNRSRYLWWGVLVILIANNGAHYLEYSTFRDDNVDRQYQTAIGEQLSPGDVLVVLDAARGVLVGTYPIVPLHGYFNQDLKHFPCSDFFADPAAPQMVAIAKAGRLYIEGLCFEGLVSRQGGVIQGAKPFLELSRFYDLEPVVEYAGYSSLYHRFYQPVFRVTPKSH